MKNVFKQIIIWIKSNLGNLLDQFKITSNTAVLIVGKLKTIVESDVVDIAVDLIPGNIDNLIVDKARIILPIVIKKLSLVSGIAQDSTTNSEAVSKFIEYLRGLEPEGRKAFWVTLAAEINIALSDGKLSFSEGVILTQLIYTELVVSRNKK
jgi:hypothetical protein